MIIFKKEKEVIELIIKHADKMEECLSTALKTLEAYLNDHIDRAKILARETDKIETEGDLIRHEIRDKLYYGAYNSKYKEKNLTNIHILAEKISILNFDDKSARLFGEIKSYLKNKGLPILDADIMIASIALANDLILVTNNTSHFERIPDLKIENWLATK